MANPDKSGDAKLQGLNGFPQGSQMPKEYNEAHKLKRDEGKTD